MPSSKPVKQPSPWAPQNRFFLLTILFAVLGEVFLGLSDKPYSLWLGLLFFVLALRRLEKVPFSVNSKDPRPLSPGKETFLFLAICVLALLVRSFRITQMPPGMHPDQGLTGLSALRVLYEGWHPFPEALGYSVPEPFLFKQLALWFGLAGPSYLSFHWFFILLSLASFPFIYWTFRQWAGNKTALLALFLLAVMRWNWIETRNGYPSIQVPFYLFGASALWLYGLKVRKQWPFFLSTLFLAAGLYTYQAFKAVPLLVLLWVLYEYRTLWRGTKVKRPKLLLYLLLLALLTYPLVHVFLKNGSLGNRERDLFIGTQVSAQGSLKPLAKVWAGTALMFNREGDGNPRHNLPGRPMLDGVTGIFFILGIGFAWRLRKKRAGFYPLAGALVLSLPALLAQDLAPSNRLVALTPFAAYFAALGGTALYRRARTLWRDPPRLGAQAFLLLMVVAGSNAYTYFVRQAEDGRCRQAFQPGVTALGLAIESTHRAFPGKSHFYADPSLLRNNTVAFLSYPARKDISEFRLEDWAQGKVPKDQVATILLGSNKSGVAAFLKTAYPGSEWTRQEDGEGQGLCHQGTVDPKVLAGSKPWGRGLKGVYFQSADWNSRPWAVQWDPVLNMVDKKDFPFTQAPPFRIRWSGSLEIPKTGTYLFQLLTTDRAKLWLDGKPVALENLVKLASGSHPLRINLEKDKGNDLALNFIWKKPGSDHWDVVPAESFGRKTP